MAQARDRRAGVSGDARGLQCGVVVVVGAEFRGRAPG